jgi:hypothetical protein
MNLAMIGVVVGISIVDNLFILNFILKNAKDYSFMIGMEIDIENYRFRTQT